MPPLAWYDVLWGLEQRAGPATARMSELAEKVVFFAQQPDPSRRPARGRRPLCSASGRRKTGAGPTRCLTMEGKAMRRRMWPVYAQGIKELFEDRVTGCAGAGDGGGIAEGTLDAARMLPEDTPGSTQPAQKQRAGKR